jgi:hypothetical protein
VLQAFIPIRANDLREAQGGGTGKDGRNGKRLKGKEIFGLTFGSGLDIVET